MPMQTYPLSIPKRGLLLVIIGLSFEVSACKSPSLTERYQALDGDQKQTFLYYYADFTPAERNSYLDDPNTLEEILFSHPSLNTSSASLNPRLKEPLLSLSILPSSNTPLKEGKELKLQTLAHFAKDQDIDVTSEVEWQVIPPLAQLQRSTLQLSCIHSEITVSARFLDEFETQTRYRIEKKIQSLLVSGEEHYSNEHRYEVTQFHLIAKCQDGTEQEVSCQADWSTQPEMGSFSVCGYFTPSAESLKQGSAVIQARYAGETLTYRLDLSHHVSR